jgi:hypothetical protein
MKTILDEMKNNALISAYEMVVGKDTQNDVKKKEDVFKFLTILYPKEMTKIIKEEDGK